MSTPLASFSIAVLLAAVPVASAAAPPGDFLFERDIAVPSAGWVRVPLDLAAVRHLAPEGADLRVLGPGGGEVPARVEPRAPRSERRPVQVVAVERGDDGWTVLLDTGAAPVSHERLFFEITRETAAPSVLLEGSRDRSAWQTLTVGDLFRLGVEDGLQRTALSYPATGHRWLRLAWPREAGFPRVSAVEVETVSGPTLAFAARGAPCREAGPQEAPATVCELSLPAAGQTLRRLTLDLEGRGTIGFRLDAPAGGAWHPLAEGVWRRTAEATRHLLPGATEPIEGEVLRLELYGENGEVPRLAGYGVDLAVPTVLFRAPEAGTYTLAYGGNVRRNGGFGPPHTGEAGEEEAWLEAGPERERPAAPLPAGAPGAPLGAGRFRGSWQVLAPSARPGDLVRLELPNVVYGVARPDLRDVRVAFGDLQVPFFHWTPPAPALAAESRDLRPRPLRRDQESEAEVDLPVSGLPLTQLFLTAPGAGPLRRTVGVRYRPRRPATRQRERAPVVRSTWDCDPEAPLPCRAGLALRGEAPEILAVRIHDGDDPPLAHLAAEVWRRRDVLFFVWPQASEESEVRLLAGAKDLDAPDYDFAVLGPVLPARSWHPAELDLEGEAARDGMWWGRWVLPAALGVAAVFLLLLLRKILSEGGNGSSGGT